MKSTKELFIHQFLGKSSSLFDVKYFLWLRWESEKFHEYVFVCSIRDITKEIAAAVIMEAIEEDLAEGYRGVDARELRKYSKVRSYF